MIIHGKHNYISCPQFYLILWLAHTYPEPFGANSPRTYIPGVSCMHFPSLSARCSSSNRAASAQQEGLSYLSRACKEAINQWCCCARDYEAQRDGPSLTIRNSPPPCKGTNIFTSLKRRIANTISPDKRSRRVLGSHGNKSDSVMELIFSLIL